MEEIPLNAGPANAHQQFTMQLGENLLDFEVDYISYLTDPAWSMNIYRDGSPLVLGAMLEPGCDVTSTYRAGIGLFIFTGLPVTMNNLGIDNHLVWIGDMP